MNIKRKRLLWFIICAVGAVIICAGCFIQSIVYRWQTYLYLDRIFYCYYDGDEPQPSIQGLHRVLNDPDKRTEKLLYVHYPKTAGLDDENKLPLFAINRKFLTYSGGIVTRRGSIYAAEWCTLDDLIAIHTGTNSYPQLLTQKDAIILLEKENEEKNSQ